MLPGFISAIKLPSILRIIFVNKKTAGKNKDSEKTTESKSPVTVKQMPDGTFEFSGGRGGFNIVAQKNKALEPYGKCI